MLHLKQTILHLFPDSGIEKINVYKIRIDQDVLAKLRVYFLSEQDVKKNPEIYQYSPKDFRKLVSPQNEQQVFRFLIENVERELKNLDLRRE